MLKTVMVVAGFAATGTFAMAAPAAANEPYLPRTERSFTTVDADKDGKVTPDELRPKAVKRVLRLDGNGDGEISTAEIDAWFSKEVERRKARLLSRLDGDKNGTVTETEISTYVDQLFLGADTDGDGSVTLLEVRASLAKRGKATQDSKGN